MDNVSALDSLPAHRDMLQRAVNYFRGDERVVGTILGGSFARGDADFYSDVDLYIVTREGSFKAVFDERDAAARTIGSPLLRFDVDPVPGGSRDYIVMYPGPVKLDLMYYRESEVKPDPKWKNGLILKDDLGSLSAVVSRSGGLGLGPPESRALLDLDQKFWTWCWYVFGKLMRGELWEALNGIHTIRSLALLPMLDWSAGRPHEGYRRLEGKLEPAMVARLAATVVPLEAQALYDALQAAVAMFCDLREVLFERHGLTFDATPERVVKGEMKRRWAARSAQDDCK